MFSIRGSVSNLNGFEAQPIFRSRVNLTNLHEQHMKVARCRWGLTASSDINHCRSLSFVLHTAHRALLHPKAEQRKGPRKEAGTNSPLS